eukprot:gnl/TRDRNA2_/TRDRNA2_166175_c0_seq1.p1 gnl/TRDRNA2_/TRDRNA2_166175_c0~~gnl/TRDRNA2_/TRDRNA2_166175_c0_seq1.p1  ORF type:complete len:234 (+),score=17.13 gnl/TRDRNA2_/TRDRNA2_166175_c0_seq1:76-777(+)
MKIVLILLAFGNCLSSYALRLDSARNPTAPSPIPAKLPKRLSTDRRPSVTTAHRNAAGAELTESFPNMHQRHLDTGNAFAALRRLSRAFREIGTNTTDPQPAILKCHEEPDYTKRLDVILKQGQVTVNSFGDKLDECGKNAFRMLHWHVDWGDFKSCFQDFERKSFNTNLLSESCIGCYYMEAKYAVDNCASKCMNSWCANECLTCMKGNDRNMQACMQRPLERTPRGKCCDC